MTCSPARLAANRKNAQMSTGPRSQAGKSRSRENALQHGLTGGCVVIAAEDAAEVEERSRAFEADLRPSGGLARVLVRHAAILSIRLERCNRQESAAIAARVRSAGADFEDQRLAEVDRAYSRIGDEPATQTRKLRSMPEGIDRLVTDLLGLREVLDLDSGERWDRAHGIRLSELMGARFEAVPVTRVRALSEAILGDFRFLRVGDGEGLDATARQTWARDQMARLILDEIDALQTIGGGLDTAAIEADRVGAATRALFDPSKEATLARRYEAAAERGFFRTLRELRQVEAEAVDRPEPAPAPAAEPLGSFFPEAPAPPQAADDAPTEPARSPGFGLDRPSGEWHRTRSPLSAGSVWVGRPPG